MAIFFILTLAFSMVGLVSLVAVKRWELATGRVLAPGARPALAEALRRLGSLTLERAPERVAGILEGSARLSLEALHRLAAWCVLKFEWLLERTLHVVRRKTEAPRGEGVASDFLREVAEHKKQLQRRSLKNRSIFEE